MPRVSQRWKRPTEKSGRMKIFEYEKKFLNILKGNDEGSISC